MNFPILASLHFIFVVLLLTILFIFLIFMYLIVIFFFFSSRRRHTISKRDWSSDVCSSDLLRAVQALELDDRGALSLEGLGCGDRDAKLLRHGLDEPDVVGRPLAGPVDLRERERAGELTADANGRG